MEDFDNSVKSKSKEAETCTAKECEAGSEHSQSLRRNPGSAVAFLAPSSCQYF